MINLADLFQSPRLNTSVEANRRGFVELQQNSRKFIRFKIRLLILQNYWKPRYFISAYASFGYYPGPINNLPVWIRALSSDSPDFTEEYEEAKTFEHMVPPYMVVFYCCCFVYIFIAFSDRVCMSVCIWVCMCVCGCVRTILNEDHILVATTDLRILNWPEKFQQSIKAATKAVFAYNVSSVSVVSFDLTSHCLPLYLHFFSKKQTSTACPGIQHV